MAAASEHNERVRTSVILSPQTIKDLESLSPNRSEAVRLALDRYFYIRQSALAWTEQITETYGELLLEVLADLDETDFRTVARVLPELVDAYAAEITMYSAITYEVSDAVEALRKLNIPARISVLDWVLEERRKSIAQPVRQQNTPKRTGK